MDVLEELEAVMEEIRTAKPVPFSASAMVNKQQLLDRLEGIKQTIPEELKQARWIMRDREELLTRTQADAEKMVTDATEQRDHMVSRTEVVGTANREADKIIEEAKARAREIRMEAEDYVDAKLANFEVVLQKTLGAVTKGRESLRGRLDDTESDEDDSGATEAVPVLPDGPTGNVRIRRR